MIGYIYVPFLDLTACTTSPIEVKPGYEVTLQSPGYPNRYEPDTTCEWHVIAPLGYNLVFYLEVVYMILPDFILC